MTESGTNIHADNIVHVVIRGVSELRRFALEFSHSHGDATGVFSQCIPENCRIDAFRQPC